jgi:hypothetical protein
MDKYTNIAYRGASLKSLSFALLCVNIAADVTTNSTEQTAATKCPLAVNTSSSKDLQISTAIFISLSRTFVTACSNVFYIRQEANNIFLSTIQRCKQFLSFNLTEAHHLCHVCFLVYWQ